MGFKAILVVSILPILLGCGQIENSIDNLSAAGECSAGSVTITTTGAGAFIIPSGCTNLIIQAWGAGTGGGEAFDDGISYYSGYGGASGAYSRKTRSATAGEVIAYNIGAGGSSDVAGEDTTVDGITAGGGNGVTGGTATGGDINTSGNIGSFGSISSACGSSAGEDGADGLSGAAGGSAGTAAPTEGGDGASPGAGGGGGGYDCLEVDFRRGGTGGNGQIVFTFE